MAVACHLDLPEHLDVAVVFLRPRQVQQVEIALVRSVSSSADLGSPAVAEGVGRPVDADRRLLEADFSTEVSQ